MKKVKFIIGIHNHQPIGNFDFVFEDAYQKSYLPFLKVLEKHPSIKVSLHYTGILLDWLVENHPDFIELIRKLVKKGQLEIMSGGYYEPILSVIPDKDKIAQINKLTLRVKQLFDYNATGIWLAERIWEPTLPSSLNDAGIKYTCVDDTHFKYAGLRDEDLDGYFISEDLGKAVSLFPINQQLRYTIPFQEPEETINELRKMASEDENKISVFADDGEKFGVWPNTYKHVYVNGWLDKFFTTLENNFSWIEMMTFDQVMLRVKPKGNIYLPTASYAEMMHWSLFKETYKQFENFEHYLKDQNVIDDVSIFVRGGFWRNFMVKYPEINVMHKKMLRISNKFETYGMNNKSDAYDALMAAQCNCPYWHGVFGGLYLSHLRHAIFSYLIKAEKILADEHPSSIKELDICDFDIDGMDEIIIETPVHNAYFKPSAGANMFLYDFKVAEKNILDTMTRREEGYHSKVYEALVGSSDQADGASSIHGDLKMKEAGLEKYLIYDDYERKSFIDHFLDLDLTVEQFYKSEYSERGSFVKDTYQLKDSKISKEMISLFFFNDGFFSHDGNLFPIRIEKNIKVMRNKELIQVDYIIKNLSKQTLKFKFASELNFGLQAGHAIDRYYYNRSGRLEDSYLDSIGSIIDSKFIGIKDEYMRIDIQLNGENADSIWRMPVETISQSEEGFEKVYQSSCILLIWNINLKNEYKISLTQKLGTF